MDTGSLGDYFKQYISSNSIFENKRCLQASYIPEEIIHREEEVRMLSSMLAPALRNELPSNIFVYGKTGTGKTVALKKIKKELETVVKENNLPLQIHYIN
ncbi:MAG: cell division control protein Cdc6, partial [Nanoarchaeota archaeon]